MHCPKAVPGDLEPLLSSHTGSNGDGWYVLLCKHCTDSHKISANNAAKKSKGALRVAASKFQKAGWRMDGDIPVCPSCYKRKVKSGLYSAD